MERPDIFKPSYGIPFYKRLFFKTLALISLSIFCIEMIILIPSAITFRKNLFKTEEKNLQNSIQLINGILQRAGESRNKELLDSLYEGIRSTHLADTLILIDPGGKPVYQKGNSRLSPLATRTRVSSALVKGKTTFTFHPELKICSFISPVLPAKDKAWAVCIEKDMRFVNKATFNYAIRILGLVFLILFLNVGAIYIVNRHLFLGPIQRIVRANKALSEGDRGRGEIPAREVPEDEFGQIMHSRNRMLNTLKQKQEEIENKNQQLREMVDFKDKFLAMVSHDIRQPLFAISGCIQLLEQSGRLGPEDIELTQLIKRSLKYLEEFVKRLLELSVARSGRLQIKRSQRDLCGIIRTTVESNQVLAKQKKIAIEFSCVPSTTYELPVDEPKIIQVLNNLLGNAMKFSYEGGKIGVHLEEKGDYLRVSVSDQGTGISPLLGDKIFQMHVKSDSGGTKGEKGYGIGLTICKKIVEAHGGTIGFGPESVKGATFYFELPKSQCEAAVIDAPAPAD